MQIFLLFPQHFSHVTKYTQSKSKRDEENRTFNRYVEGEDEEKLFVNTNGEFLLKIWQSFVKAKETRFCLNANKFIEIIHTVW